VAEVKAKIEQAANLPLGRVVRWLTWGITKLHDDEVLQDVGFCSADVHLVAICADAIVGEFEVFSPGCPTCDYNSELQRVQLFDDGTASIQHGPYGVFEKYHYLLGELKIWSHGTERLMQFRGDDGPTEGHVHNASIYVSATNHINRRVTIPALGIQVEDVRLLKQRGQDFLNVKMQMLFDYTDGDVASTWARGARYWLAASGPVEFSAEVVDEAALRAWTKWQQQDQLFLGEALPVFHPKKHRRYRPQGHPCKKEQRMQAERKRAAAERQALLKRRSKERGTWRWARSE